MKRFGRMGLIFALSTGLLAVVPGTVLAAQPVCGDVLTQDTTLTADLDCSAVGGTALYFGKSRIVLNLNGHKILGDGDPVDDNDVGVDTQGYHHTVIKNGSIRNFSTGIDVDYSNDTRLRNLTIGPAADTNDAAIVINGGVGNVVRDVYVEGGFSYGIDMYGSASNRIFDNEFHSVGTGIYIEYGSSNIFTNNWIDAAYYGVEDYYSGENRYVGNTAENGSETGFYMDCSSYGRVFMTGNTARDFGGDGFYTYECYANSGSWAPGTGSVMRENRAINNGGSGFDDNYSINSKWISNVANSNDDDGFYFEYPSGYVIRLNKAKLNGDDGFEFYNAYSTGYYAPYDVSRNVAKRNTDFGYISDYGIASHDNVSRYNGADCYNVACN